MGKPFRITDPKPPAAPPPEAARVPVKQILDEVTTTGLDLLRVNQLHETPDHPPELPWPAVVKQVPFKGLR